MPDYATLKAALEAADAAGDVEAAKELAQRLTSGDYDDTVSELGSAGRGALQGATFGFSDEIAGGLSAVGGEIGEFFGGEERDFSDRYSDTRDYMRNLQAADRRENPWITGLSEVGGGLLTGGAGLGRMVAGKGIAAAMGSGALGGSATGAFGALGYSNRDLASIMAGETTDQETQEILRDTFGDVTLGAAFGGVSGAVLPQVVTGLRSAGRVLSGKLTRDRRLKENARQILMENIQTDLEERGITLAQAQAEIDSIPGMSIADLGMSTQDLTEQVGQTASKGGGRLRKWLEQRNTEQWGRMHPRLKQLFDETDMKVKTGNDDPLLLHRQKLLNDMRERAGASYGAAEQIPIRVTQRMENIINHAEGRKALQTANRLRRISGKRQFGIDDVGPDEVILPKRGQMMSTEEVDQIIRGWDDMISEAYTGGQGSVGKALKPLREELREEVYAQNKAYLNARRQWGSDKSNEEAFVAGQKLFREDVDELTDLLGDMSDADKTFFRIGAAKEVMRRLKSKSDTSDLTKGIFDSEQKRQAVREVFGNPKAFQEFVDYLAMEQRMFDTFKKVTGNSATARRLNQMASHTSVGAELAAIFGYTAGLKGGGIAPAMVGHATRRSYEALANPQGRAVRNLQTAADHTADMLMSSNLPDVSRPDTIYGLLNTGTARTGGQLTGAGIASGLLIPDDR